MVSIEFHNLASDHEGLASPALPQPEKSAVECAGCASSESVVVETIKLYPPPSTNVYVELTCLGCDSTYTCRLDRTHHAELLLNGEPLADLCHVSLLHCGEPMALEESVLQDFSLLRCRCGFVVEAPLYFPPAG